MHDIVVLTGAGISAESGLGTFRDIDGIWTKYDLEDVATPGGFRRNPGLVQDFYNQRRRQLRQAAPNAAHLALAELEAALEPVGGRFLVVTQNVDDLHEKAGSRSIVHMHGELLSALCETCSARARWADDLAADCTCPGCGVAGGLRPDVVWFGEAPYHMDRIHRRIAACDMFVSIGTSGEVYPASGLVSLARSMGAVTLELNLEPSANARTFDEGRYGPASEVVPAWTSALILSIEAAARGS